MKNLLISSSLLWGGCCAVEAFVPLLLDRSSSRSSKPLQTASIDINSSSTSPLSSPRNDLLMSESIPFLACPRPLVDCDLTGNVGFDPLGLAGTKEQLWVYREAEIKHARLAMLAAVGWPLSELSDRPIAEWVGLPPVLDATDRGASLLNVGLDRVSPVWWGFCVGLTAAIDMYGLSKARAGDPSYFPGKLDYDPLGLYPQEEDGRRRMQLAEIKHGRLAMVAVIAYAAQKWVLSEGIVEETPLFFHPVESMFA